MTLEAEVGAVEVESMLPGEDALSMMDWLQYSFLETGRAAGVQCELRKVLVRWILAHAESRRLEREKNDRKMTLRFQPKEGVEG